MTFQASETNPVRNTEAAEVEPSVRAPQPRLAHLNLDACVHGNGPGCRACSRSSAIIQAKDLPGGINGDLEVWSDSDEGEIVGDEVPRNGSWAFLMSAKMGPKIRCRANNSGYERRH